MLDVTLRPGPPTIVELLFRGRLEVEDFKSDRRFVEHIEKLAGAPFRMLCDFSNTMLMREEVADLFLRAQDFAVAHGLERDAYVCQVPVLELQLSRLARSTARGEALGSLRFFERREDADIYLRG